MANTWCVACVWGCGRRNVRICDKKACINCNFHVIDVENMLLLYIISNLLMFTSFASFCLLFFVYFFVVVLLIQNYLLKNYLGLSFIFIFQCATDWEWACLCVCDLKSIYILKPLIFRLSIVPFTLYLQMSICIVIFYRFSLNLKFHLIHTFHSLFKNCCETLLFIYYLLHWFDFGCCYCCFFLQPISNCCTFDLPSVHFSCDWM